MINSFASFRQPLHILFTGFLLTGMVESKLTRRRLSARRETQLADVIKKAVMDGEIPKARRMIGQLVRDSIKCNTCLNFSDLPETSGKKRKLGAIRHEIHLITREIHLIYPRNSHAHIILLGCCCRILVCLVVVVEVCSVFSQLSFFVSLCFVFRDTN